MDKKESFRISPINGFPRYFISTDGRVFSEVFGPIKQLKSKLTSGGYLNVNISTGERIRPKLIHRLVLEAFVGPCPEGMETRHLNGNPADNRLQNLQWSTPKENQADRKKHGTDIYFRGEKCSNSRLTERDVLEIRASELPQGKLAEIFGVTQGHISEIVNRRTWAHVQ